MTSSAVLEKFSMARSTLSDRFFQALPWVYIGGGALAIVALRNGLAVLSGLILIGVGCIELLRRNRFGRELEASESRLSSRMRVDREGPATQSLMRISWRKSFECGHPEIDEQHRHLFEIGDGLIDAVMKGKAKEHIEFLLEDLTEHIREHFITEEAVMARTRYPLSQDHRGQHTRLLEKAQVLSQRYRGGLVDVSELVGFIAYDVITEHILREDRKFARSEPQAVAA